MIESLGPFRLRLRAEVRDHRLHYMLERVTLLGAPAPRRYDFAVEVRLPRIGRLVRYEGLLDLAT